MANRDPSEWATFGPDLLLEVSSGSGLRSGIEHALREAIRSGRLPRGFALPATRVLARDLGVSRGTVLAAYSQLTAEGWLAGRRGSSTTVAVDSDRGRLQEERRAPVPVAPRFDLRPGRPDSSSFPRAEWLRALRRALASAPDSTLDYGDPRGQFDLRVELAAYLRRARGLQVSADQLVITTGFTQSLYLLANALALLGVTRVAMEEPSMPDHRAVVQSAGHEIIPLVIDDHGARVDDLGDARAVVLTPGRQHPLGATLSSSRRSQLLEWARDRDALIVEDDYDGEFRYDGHPIGSLQGLEPRAVAYAGTASKTLAPGVRLGWLAVPEVYLEPIVHAKRLSDWQSGSLEQLALAELIRSGGYDRHIRKMRLRYRRRRDTMVAALRERTPRLPVAGASAGLNLLVALPSRKAERSALAITGAAGVAVEGLHTGGYYRGRGRAGLIVGYAAAPEHAYDAAVDAFTRALAVAVEAGWRS
jgi:GntR family transcriptional regulator / MocR family aminotransferase